MKNSGISNYSLRLSFFLLSLITWESSFALTISPGMTTGIITTPDKNNQITTFTATDAGANLNSQMVELALSVGNVVIKDNAEQNITINNGTTIAWSSPYHLIINAPQNIVIGNLAKLTSHGYGGLVLRADFAANNEGTVITPNDTQPSIYMLGGGSVKIYYRPKSYTTPTDFSSSVKVTDPGVFVAYMAINNVPDLQKMNQNLKGDYAIATNLDGEGINYSPVGSYNNPFTGRFDGQGYHISNLFVGLPNIDYAGLFGGANRATIENVVLEKVNITGRDYVGGLSGYGYAVNVSNCSVSGDVRGRDNVGGLIGYVSYGAVINKSFSTGNVSLSGYDGGGLIGYAVQQWVSILNSYSQSNVLNIGGSALSLGGLSGYNSYVSTKNCYATGSVANMTNTGGLLGYAAIGSNFDGVFWDKETSGQTKAAGTSAELAGAFGKTKEQMQHENTFLAAGWDFNFTWGIDEGLGYPYLIWTKNPAPWTFMPTGQVKLRLALG